MLAVTSSTALYVNGVLFMLLGEYGNPYYANPYLNIWVFGINANSMVNDVGMLLLSEMLKTVSCGALARLYSTIDPRKQSQEVAIVSVSNSRAYENA